MGTAALASGDVCGSWNTFECCTMNEFTSCDDATKKSVADKLAIQKTTFGAINPTLASCTANCAGGASTVAQPIKVEQTFNALITMDDPTTFIVQRFIDAVKAATGVTDVPTAVVKAFEVIVQYAVPHAATLAQVKAAVATGNDVQESQVTVSESARRRLQGATPTEKDVDVTITIDGSTDPATAAAKAKAVKAQPKAMAKVETKVNAEASKAAQIKSPISSKAVGSAVGGTVTVPTAPLPQGSGHAASCATTVSVALASIMIIVQAAM